jgi:HEAT repeat protein
VKSNTEQLESRGYVAEEMENDYQDTSFEQRIKLLKSKLPTDRTLGARLLAGYPDSSAIDYLIDGLKIEKKLYPKIEISNSLVSFGRDAVVPLITLLGKIGGNQHREVPVGRFKKESYPLPHDIAGRTLIRIGTVALPHLLEVLGTHDLIQLSEAIDAIGFICFYDYQTNVFGLLKDCFYRNNTHDLIKWKILRAMGAFPESESFLKEQLELSPACLKAEIERSLSLIVK